jgi:hypothetical protein
MTMTVNRILGFPLVLAALLLASTAAAQGQRLALLPTQDGDLVVAAVVAAQRGAQATAERTPLQFSQPLAADAVLAPVAQPYLAESREYWQRVDGERLRAGFALALTAPGAVVLVSPGPGADPLRREQFALASNGRGVDFASATQTLVDADALHQAGMAVAPGSVGFRLRDGHEVNAVLQVNGARGDYVLHVLEPRSAQVLSARGTHDTVHAGTAVGFELALAGGARFDAAMGLLAGPDGRVVDVGFAADGAGQRGHAVLPAQVTAQPGLWELRATVAARVDGRAFQRDVRVALAVVAPTARLGGEVVAGPASRGQGRSLDVAVEVGTAGRYELRTVLYGTDAGGARVPMAELHSAAWLEPGQRSLRLTLPVAARGGPRAPYELRDLRLGDQGAVALLGRGARARVLE